MRVRIHPVLLFLILSLGEPTLIHADEKTENREFPEWAFCVGHVIRDADERDERPRDPKDDDPTRIAAST